MKLRFWNADELVCVRTSSWSALTLQKTRIGQQTVQTRLFAKANASPLVRLYSFLMSCRHSHWHEQRSRRFWGSAARKNSSSRRSGLALCYAFVVLFSFVRSHPAKGRWRSLRRVCAAQYLLAMSGMRRTETYLLLLA
jgi:hypothetical protein